jgi:hypothetical protein
MKNYMNIALIWIALAIAIVVSWAVVVGIGYSVFRFLTYIF